MKKFFLVVLTLLLAALIALAVFWDPIMDYLNVDQSGWIIKNESRYYLNETGDPLTGLQTVGGRQYYFDPQTGAMQTGWQQIGGDRYNFGADGRMLRNCWLQDGTNSCYLQADGTMATGWVNDGTTRRYFNENGTPASSWTEIDGKLSYFGDKGVVLTGWQDIDGQRYYLNEDGSVYYGWLELDGSRYYLNEEGVPATGWLQTDEGLFYMNENGTAASGWVEVEGTRYYIGENGRCAEGWNEIDGKRYYFNSDGSYQTGWLELDGSKYYLTEDGSAATGKLVIEEKTYYFTSTGANILLVNPSNYIPEDYQVELADLEDGHQVAKVMEAALLKMLADCEAAGHKAFLKSAYRTENTQQVLFNNMVAKHGGNKTTAAQVVAVPGTSEHQLGLAVDITDDNYRELDYDQEKTETQQWLMEHCWDYGFILRYPNDKSEITGIIYEPWHYRYVGTELALEMKGNGLCLEEYLEQLTVSNSTETAQ